jgi:uncharacterized protein involved in exopolysaccharide biosynthesis
MEETSNKLIENSNPDNRRKLDFSDLDLIEIDLVEKSRLIWKGRTTVMLITACFLFIGLFHNTFAPEEFESTAILIQEVESSGGFEGGSNFLRSLTGMNFPAGGGNLSSAARGRTPLPVNLYPLIVNSTEFQKDLIYREIEFANLDTTLTLFDYFTNHFKPPFRDRVYSHIRDWTIFLPYTLLTEGRNLVRQVRRSLIGSSSDAHDFQSVLLAENGIVIEPETDSRLLMITRQERSVIERLRLRISVVVGGSTTEIKTMLPDPKAAALVNALLVERIQEYMTEYRVEKARQNLEDTIKQYEDARQRFDEANYELARFLDENLNIRSNVVQLQEENLRAQRNLRLSVVNSLAQEVEQARLVMQQEIPVFNTLEKPNIPNSSSTGSSDLILVFSVLLGLFVGSGWVLLKSKS